MVGYCGSATNILADFPRAAVISQKQKSFENQAPILHRCSKKIEIGEISGAKTTGAVAGNQLRHVGLEKSLFQPFDAGVNYCFDKPR